MKNIIADVGAMGPSVLSTNLSSLQLRILSALVLAPIAVGAVYLGGPYFAVFLALSTAAMSYEWCQTSFVKNKSSYIILVTIWLLFSLYLGFEGYIQIAFITVLICAIGVISLTWFRREEREWKGAFLGPIYIGVPVLCLMALRDDIENGFNLTIFLFFIVWATDIGAYFAGRSIGGPKIAPSISPNKTWAGLLGGMAASAIVAVLLNMYLLQLEIAPGMLMLIGALLAVVAQSGDFAESGWKRRFAIKDASNLIPGHGGVLDRLDGVLFVAPVLYMIKTLVGF